MLYKRVLVLVAIVVSLGGCSGGCSALLPPLTPTVAPEVTPEVAMELSESPTPAGARVTPSATTVATAAPAASPTATAPPIAAASETPTAPLLPTATTEPTRTATPSPRSPVIRVESTFTPRPGDEETAIELLPLGQPGNYVNVTYGYWLQYPEDWHTHFGNRPLLVSFSNLDPGTHNRQSMREQGCLIEVNVSTNIYGFTLDTLAAQLPRSFASAREFELGGEKAWRVQRESDSLFASEWVTVLHDGRLFTLTFDYARNARETCVAAWDNMLAAWRWFTPSFAQYRNTTYGYAISHPRRWYRFNASEQGVFISDLVPSGATDWVGLMAQGMVVETWVYPNPSGLRLKEWVVVESDKGDTDLTNDIPLDGIIGVRVLSKGLSDDTEEMTGFFQGPLGKIYMVACYYPITHRWEYRPVANAIIYSFTF